MKTLGDIAKGIQWRIKAPRKKPRIELLQGRQAALKQLQENHPDYAVIPWRVFLHDNVMRDPSALAVLFAYALHAKKHSGITECGQERIAALCGISTRTVQRKVAMLQDAGLVKLEYRRPINGNPLKRMNVMRIVYDDGTLTRQDVQSIAQPGPAHTRQHDVAYSSQLSTGQGEQSTEQPAHMRHSSVAYGHDTPANHIHDKALSHTIGDTALSSEQSNILKTTDILAVMNRELQRYKAPAIEATPEALATINGSSFTEGQIVGAVADYLLACQDNRKAPAPTVQAILAEVVALH